MTTISILGIDIAKSIFQLHGADRTGKAVHKRRLSRHELAAHLANLPTCTIVMESCGGANYWARVFQSSGHSVKLIGAQFVKPFVKTNKNDANDAQAIVEAASRPSMHFVPIKHVPGVRGCPYPWSCASQIFSLCGHCQQR
jgi:transposase